MRRCALWLSVVSFVLVAICSAVVSFLSWFLANPHPVAPGSRAVKLFTGATSQVFEIATLIMSIALPVGLISVSVYMLQTERMLRDRASEHISKAASARPTGRDA